MVTIDDMVAALRLREADLTPDQLALLRKAERSIDIGEPMTPREADYFRTVYERVIVGG